jgi:DNA invertase Pin-like site-specific DNA recombinase
MASEGDATLEAAPDDVEPDRSAVTDAAPEETVALYCRISTDEQNLDRQRELIYEYATERLGLPPSAIEVYIDKGTGTNTDRRGYANLIANLETGDIDHVIVAEVSRLSRSVQDFAASVERIVDEYNAALHVLDMDLDLDLNERDPYTRAFLYGHRDVRRTRGEDQSSRTAL